MNDKTAWLNSLKLVESGHDIRTVQELLGYKDVRTTMFFPHVLNWGGKGVQTQE